MDPFAYKLFTDSNMRITTLLDLISSRATCGRVNFIVHQLVQIHSTELNLI